MMLLLLAALTIAQTAPPTGTPPATGGRRQFTPEEIAARQKAQQDQMKNDWPNLGRYREANGNLPPAAAGETRVVFMGDSITELWDRDLGKFFASKGYIGRGIGGQTTPQMLLRFQQDVVALQPKVVVINGGTNDIAGNTGPSTLEMIENNLKSMAQLAAANGIKVVLDVGDTRIRLPVEARS